MFKLKEFVVESFRSIRKTEPILIDETCVIVGVNEAGKSNALLALCRTNPANQEFAIRTKEDVPRTLFNEYEAVKFKKPFCHATYAVDPAFVERVQSLYKFGRVTFSEIKVTSFFDGSKVYAVKDWTVAPIEQVVLVSLIHESLRNIPGVSAIPMGDSANRIHLLAEILRALPATTPANPEVGTSIKALEKAHSEVVKWSSSEIPAEVIGEIPGALPKFIYFTRYGSLESSVRLDSYMQVKDRTDLPKPDRERNRTITALFRFTGIDPSQLRGMAGGDANQMDLRQIKLTSGASKLTKEFNAWWKQHETEYIFRFTLDNDYFRIWVEDQRSKVPIELENRSAGFQWFLGFFVTFLVESEDAHKNTILLLDEPGVTLHPTAQRDLIEFFKNLSSKNQLLYTTHSPFLIDNQNIDNVVAAYLNEAGETTITRDLGAAGKKTTKRNSVYPVHAALGLSVANTFLADHYPVFVEGSSDQILLSGFLVALKRHKAWPLVDPFFVPFGGVRSLGPILRLLTAGNGQIFPILLDADEAGTSMAKEIQNGVYQKNRDSVILVSKVCAKKNAELEDLVPLEIFNRAVDKYFNRKMDGVTYVPITADASYVDQVEAQSPPEDWKIDVASFIKDELKQGSLVAAESVKPWRALFESLGVKFS